MGAVSLAVKELGQAVLATSSDLSGAAGATQTFGQYKDVFDLTRQIELRSGPDERLRQACQQVQRTLEQAVLAEQHHPTHPGAHGLQIELDPEAAAREGSACGETAFATEMGWAEATRKLTRA
ncbi:hypothetical protein DYH09_01785 [bacterium CPR1]|nr:hypothetical protein [bacterium CPR1]